VDDRGRRDHAEDALRKRLAETPFAAAQITIEVGDPYREIVHYAERERVDLIVVPSHGHSGLHAPPFLIGSVAERVARHAHCPVLVLRK
jgi:nucleotide-binding universal stress UspA family protein